MGHLAVVFLAEICWLNLGEPQKTLPQHGINVDLVLWVLPKISLVKDGNLKNLPILQLHIMPLKNQNASMDWESVVGGPLFYDPVL